MNKTIKWLLVTLLACGLYASYADGFSYHDPADFSGWECFRTQVQHPAGIYRAEDIARLRQAVQSDEQVAAQAQKVAKDADGVLEQITPQFLEEWIGFQKGGGTSAPCPACRDKGLPWHPGGSCNYKDKGWRVHGPR